MQKNDFPDVIAPSTPPSRRLFTFWARCSPYRALFSRLPGRLSGIGLFASAACLTLLRALHRDFTSNAHYRLVRKRAYKPRLQMILADYLVIEQDLLARLRYYRQELPGNRLLGTFHHWLRLRKLCSSPAHKTVNVLSPPPQIPKTKTSKRATATEVQKPHEKFPHNEVEPQEPIASATGRSQKS